MNDRSSVRGLPHHLLFHHGHLQDYHHVANTWKPKEVPKKKSPKEYEVEEVVGKRTFEDGAVQYKIKWKDFDEDHCTWEPISHLDHAKQAVAAYEDAHK